MAKKYHFVVTFLIPKVIELEASEEIQAEWQAARQLTKRERALVTEVKLLCRDEQYPIETPYYEPDKDWWE